VVADQRERQTNRGKGTTKRLVGGWERERVDSVGRLMGEKSVSAGALKGPWG